MTPPQRVLVVDDEPPVREAIHDALAGAELDCELAATGAEALKAAEDPRIACVLLDVRLPDRSGVEVLRALREQRPALRVIALSTVGDQELVLEALRRGASDYLAKPIHAEELRLAVGRALEQYGVCSRFESLRGQLQRLATHTAALAQAASGGAAEPELGGRIAAALAEILGAERAGWLRLSPDGSRLRLEAAHGHGSAPEDAGEVAVDESLAGLAVREGRALRIDDVESDPRCARRVRRPPLRGPSVILAPLDAGEGCFGVLAAGERILPGPFSEEDLAILRVFAPQAAQWLAGAGGRAERAPARSAEGVDPVELLRSICDAMTREIEPSRLLAATLAPVGKAVSARVVSVHLIDNPRGILLCEAQWEGVDSDRPELPRERGLTGGSLQSGMLVAAERPDRDPRFDPEVDTPASGRVGPLLVVPLRVRDRTLGVARIFPSPEFGASARLGEVLSAPLSAAVRNVLLYRSLLEAVDDVARARREAEGRS